MDVGDFADALGQWLDAATLGRVVLVGHSSGTQVAARVTSRSEALVLASPTIDPRFRSLPRVLLAWRRNHELEPPELDRVHTPERQRAGLRRVRHALAVHLRDALEDVVPQVAVPVLVLWGDTDRLCTEAWARHLAEIAPDGRFATVPGAHSFPFTSPVAWSDPIRRLAEEVGGLLDA
jgi:pimeloyl-ACP methyl ester carboxylesterase